MVIGSPVALGHTDPVERRAFAHPDHIPADRAVVCMLLRDFAAQAARADPRRPTVRYLPAPEDWYRRVVIPRPLPRRATLTVVGFFGRMRDLIPEDISQRMAQLNDQMIDAVIDAPGMLGYTTHLLADERNYANLVLMRHSETITEWTASTAHRAATSEVAPCYYEYVRIYYGSIPTPALSQPDALTLSSVKYWDYRCDPVWHAVRPLTG